MSAEAALKFAAENKVEFVDVRFTDLLGQWHHLTIPIEEFGVDAFENGVGFDASSLRGWAAINESDMLLIPDSSRYWIDPFMKPATLCLISSVFDPYSSAYSADRVSAGSLPSFRTGTRPAGSSTSTRPTSTASVTRAAAT